MKDGIDITGNLLNPTPNIRDIIKEGLDNKIKEKEAKKEKAKEEKKDD
jgi:ABC-type dipeptide/oligopeptide/nickel transport system ATPase subunit